MKYDDADNKKPGWKFAEYKLKGVPVRLAIGGRDLENNTIEVMRRDTWRRKRSLVMALRIREESVGGNQANIFKKAYDHREVTS